MPITRKAFTFHCFDSTVEVPFPNTKVDRELIDFYLKYDQPQYLTWSAQKITTVKVLKPTPTCKFVNVRFKITRGFANSVSMISLADLPNLNPHDWILLYNILLTNSKEYEPILEHLKRMLASYIYEVATMDQEIEKVMNKKPTVKTTQKLGDVNQMMIGQIDSKHLTVMFTKGEANRICLTSDAWTSIVTDGYLSLTAHYVNSKWVLQKRILNFSEFPPPHIGVAIAEKLSGLIKSWGIERKLFSITLDNASSNDVCVGLLKNQLHLMNSIVYDGKLFHLRCCAHILNLIVQDGLKQIDVVVEKVRECVKYVKGSSVRKTRFSQCCSRNLLDTKKALMQDVPTRWNSTYMMLSCSLYYRLAFSHHSLSDSNFHDCPSSDEWERVEKMGRFLNVFYHTTLQFLGSLYPTSNLYFPQIFGIHLKLVEEKKNPDEYMKKIATQIWNKFNKYLADFNVLLAIVVVFDPRYKLSFIEYCYKKLYGKGSSKFKAIESALYELYDEYVQASKNATTSDLTSHQWSNDNIRQINVGGESSQKNILELFSFQTSESAFSLGGRNLNEYQSSMKPDVVEALVCSRDSLFGCKVDLDVAIDNLTQNVMNLNINEDNIEVILKKLMLEEEMGILA
ncbi:zinc finger BED domain-containing protein RICESLEEPER 2-like [Lactuca sativa]|uniref:zinc finger BED domain-containing protein RICESLEEPER 2-like n=1 Tax=Lactuca sativa TaxID=4236 RepID=UPI0022AFFE57|nr:zinc finger BED domain-containing protein RICESLEEPER 2-like [Lactuca sativa]